MKKGWEITTLGEVCDFVRGPFGGSLKKNCFVEKGYAVYEQQNAIYNRYEFRYFIDANKFCEMSRFKVSAGDLIMSCSGTMGKISIVPNSAPEGIINQALLKLTTKKEIINTYLKCYIESETFQDTLKKLAQGVAVENVASVKILKQIPIPIPPIEEQEEIVERLDKGFELIDSLKETAKKNLDNAKELFQSVLREELSPKDGWETKTLGELCIIAPQKKEVREKLNDNDLVTFLPMEDLGIMQKNINPQKTKLLSEVINGYTYFAENDILLAKVTPCFENGKLGIAKNLCNQIGFGSSEYIVLRAKDIKSEYIYYNLSSESFRNNGKKLMIGACGLKRLPKDYVNNFEIHFPESSKEQEEIVGRLDLIKGYCEELEGNYKRVLELCEELKQGLLREAFSY